MSAAEVLCGECWAPCTYIEEIVIPSTGKKLAGWMCFAATKHGGKDHIYCPQPVEEAKEETNGQN